MVIAGSRNVEFVKRLFWFLQVLVMVPPCVGYECSKGDDVCITSLDISYHLTMTHSQYLAVFTENSKLYQYDVLNTSNANPVPVGEVITADGWENQRIVTVANKTMPGPPIIVYEGQLLIVHVKNNLLSETVSIHWHGIPQTGNPHMDGAAFVTQCPILPGQTFTYKFRATPKGTYWYHSHIGFQRSNGLFGALIVREIGPTSIEDRILQVQDWNHDWDSNRDHMNQLYGMIVNRQIFAVPQSLDGEFFSLFKTHSGLINGKGRIHNFTTGTHNNAPLEIVNVQSNKQYRVRVINTGAAFPFRFSVDEHLLTVVASDGHDVQPIIIESFVIHPGERYDVIINTTMPTGNYWIRAETLEIGKDLHIAEAILRYSGAPDEDPSTSKRLCTNQSKCRVLNCMFLYYLPEDNIECIHVDQLRSVQGNSPSKTDGAFKEFFFNFGWPGTTFWPNSINGRQFVVPSVPVLTQPSEFDTGCEHRDCGEQKVCTCSYSLSINQGDVVQLVFVNMGKGYGGSHPIHLHGHSFHVLKIGFGIYNETTGIFQGINGQNSDIDCGGGVPRYESFCNDAKWSNTSWQNGNVPGTVIQNSPLKDTINVPPGGYVVTRIRADNPGIWLLHCHIESHSAIGMTMMINESFQHIPGPPTGFPMCRGFTFADQDTDIDNNTENVAQTDNKISLRLFVVVIAVLGCIILLLSFASLLQCTRNSNRRKTINQ